MADSKTPANKPAANDQKQSKASQATQASTAQTKQTQPQAKGEKAPAEAKQPAAPAEPKVVDIPVYELAEKYNSDEEIGKLRGQQKAVIAALRQIKGVGTAEEVDAVVDKAVTKQNSLSVVRYHLERALSEGLVKEGKPRQVTQEPKPQAKKNGETATEAKTETPATTSQ